MTHASPHPDPQTLAATLRLWVIEIMLWLAERLVDGPLCDMLRRWTLHQLDHAERGAAGLVVLAALKLLPEPVSLPIKRARHPHNAPQGFARVRIRGNDMRRVTRHLFPRERDLLKRARRLDDFLDALDTRAQRLTRRIARIMPATRLAMLAPLATACVSCVDAIAANAPDTS